MTRASAFWLLAVDQEVPPDGTVIDILMSTLGGGLGGEGIDGGRCGVGGDGGLTGGG